ncbi:MAG: UDP-N-acetylmuramoyl-L-alanine--D-glutamate ligase, partial [Caulobacteraceae bacterium]
MIAVGIFEGKSVAVFGLGRSGLAAARALTAGGARVVGWDDSDASRAAAKAQGLALEDL